MDSYLPPCLCPVFPSFPCFVLHISLLIVPISSHTFSTIRRTSSIVRKLTFRHYHLNLSLCLIAIISPIIKTRFVALLLHNCLSLVPLTPRTKINKCGTVAYVMDKNEEHKQWLPTQQLLGVVQRKSEFLLSEFLKFYLAFHKP